MIELGFLGGAGTVTGSRHLVRTSRATVLLECGLFQGHRAEANRRNRSLPIDAATLDAVVLSHAHLDHSGALPVLAHHDDRGPIYATPATRDLCAPMLEDAASIQLADARHIERLIARGVDLDPITPLYDHDDVVAALELMIGLPYHHRQTIPERTTARTAAFMPGASPPLVSTAIRFTERLHPARADRAGSCAWLTSLRARRRHRSDHHHLQSRRHRRSRRHDRFADRWPRSSKAGASPSAGA